MLPVVIKHFPFGFLQLIFEASSSGRCGKTARLLHFLPAGVHPPRVFFLNVLQIQGTLASLQVDFLYFLSLLILFTVRVEWESSISSDKLVLQCPYLSPESGWGSLGRTCTYRSSFRSSSPFHTPDTHTCYYVSVDPHFSLPANWPSVTVPLKINWYSHTFCVPLLV